MDNGVRPVLTPPFAEGHRKVNVEQVQSQAATSRGGRNACEASTVRTRSDARPPLGDGFTLIELMITVAVIAILAAIAIPAYGDYVRRSKITEAASSLSDMRNRLEQYFLDNRQFPTNCIPAAAGPAPAGSIYLPGGHSISRLPVPFRPRQHTRSPRPESRRKAWAIRLHDNEANTRGTASLPSGWSGAGSSCWVTSKRGVLNEPSCRDTGLHADRTGDGANHCRNADDACIAVVHEFPA